MFSALALVLSAGALAAPGALHEPYRVVVRWRTASEAEMLGFHVYRQVGQRRVRLSHHLIASLGAVSGSAYSFLDRNAPKRGVLRYWLQEVALDGSRAWHGPIRTRSG